MSNENAAFVFDTNFIIQNHDLETVTQKLMDNSFIVYVTQVAIDERIAQVCNSIKEKYDELERSKQKFSEFASIKVTKEYNETQQYYKDGMKKKYESLFGENIIPLSISQDAFSRVLERAYAKVPPFIKGSSDKGFKDTLMWMSIIDYFTKNGEFKVIFVTDDNGFRDNIDILQKEFNDLTGKMIEIKRNSYYKELVDPRPQPKQQEDVIHIANLTDLRDKIQEIINEVCWVESEDYWGNLERDRTFTTSKPFDAHYIEQIFEQLGSKIESHILENSVSAFTILDIDNRIKNGSVQIPMTSLENLLKLYIDIKNQYKDYIQPFYLAAISMFNQNCEYSLDDILDEELPF